MIKKFINNMRLPCLTLLSLFMLVLTACDNDNQDQQASAPDTSVDVVTNVNIPSDISEIRFLVEPLDVLPDWYISHNIVSIFMYDGLVYIPRIIERMKFSEEFIGEDFEWWWYVHSIQSHEAGNANLISEIAGPEGERLVVGQDIIYGEDFITRPYFQLYEVDYEHGSSDIIVMKLFDDDVAFVNILAFDIVTMQEPGSFRFLANQFHDNGEFSIIFSELTRHDREHSATIIEHNLLGGMNVFVRDALFDTDGNIIILTDDPHSQTQEIIVLDSTATQRLARLDASPGTALTRGVDGNIWSIENVFSPMGNVISLRSLSTSTWSWIDVADLSILSSARALYVAPENSEFEWFVCTGIELYGVTEDYELIQYLIWHNVDVSISHNTELLFPNIGEIIVLNQEPHTRREGAVALDSLLLRRTDMLDEREVLTIGGVGIMHDLALMDLVRRFNRESETHRAVIYDYMADGGGIGVAVQLRTDLIAGRGPDVIVFNQWGDENDITSALMRGDWLADLNVFLENDPLLSRDDMFENILDIWTNDQEHLTMIAGTVLPTPFWGPSELLEDFTDFTHKGFLEFLRNAEAQGIPYPMGINFFQQVVLQNMLFADNTFFCFTSGDVNFNSDLFIDILNYVDSIPDDRQARLTEAMNTGEFWEPVAFIARGEQLLTRMLGIISISDFRVFDASVGGLTPIGAPNAAGDLSISTRPITRMGIRADIPNAYAAWEFIRLAVLYPNNEGTQGLPIMRSLFEYDIDIALREATPLDTNWLNGMEIPPFTEERAAVLRLIMESITHEYHPDPHVMAIVWEEVPAFLMGMRSAEDAARIIQNRVATYVSEQTG